MARPSPSIWLKTDSVMGVSSAGRRPRLERRLPLAHARGGLARGGGERAARGGAGREAPTAGPLRIGTSPDTFLRVCRSPRHHLLAAVRVLQADQRARTAASEARRRLDELGLWHLAFESLEEIHAAKLLTLAHASGAHQDA